MRVRKCLRNAVLTLGVLSGCVSSIPKLDMRGGPQDPQTSADRARAADRRGEIPAMKVVVVAAPMTGCFKPLAEAMRCLPLAARDEPAAQKELASLIARHDAEATGLILVGWGEALADVLRARLGSIGARVTVEERENARPDAYTVRPELRSIHGPTELELFIHAPDGSSFTARGGSEHSWNRAHLAWAVPGMMVTFPFGLALIRPAIQPIVDEAMQAALVDAAERASLRLAPELAVRSRSASGTALAESTH